MQQVEKERKKDTNYWMDANCARRVRIFTREGQMGVLQGRQTQTKPFLFCAHLSFFLSFFWVYLGV
jgi:hypothetical protein